MLWVVLFSLGLGAIVPFLVPLLYGEAYSAALPAFYILLPAMGLLTVYRVVARYFISRGRQRLNIVTQLIALVVNVGLNFVLMPRYGIEGAAVSSLISYGLEAVIIAVVFLRETGGGARALLLFRLDWFRGEDWAVYQRRIDGLRARFRGRTRPPPN
jgi:O-antigen/teichoic acid export membrane protein